MSVRLKGRLTVLLLAFAWMAFASGRAAQAATLLGYGELVRQDFSDCGNSDVAVNGDYSRVGGGVSIVQTSTGATTVAVNITDGTPNTTYDFFWKCYFGLGQVQTDDTGRGSASFSLQVTPGHTFTFDMYPAGAPLGNKFQSVQITPAAATKGGSGALVLQNEANCDNAGVTASFPSTVGGSVTLVQNVSGLTAAFVQITGGAPSSNYDFYWKCYRWLGRVPLDASGNGSATFLFFTIAGWTLAFNAEPADVEPWGYKLQGVPVVLNAF